MGERAALTTSVRSATVTALGEVSAMVVPAERFTEFLRGHPRAAEVLERQVTERREEDRMRLFPGERVGAGSSVTTIPTPSPRAPPWPASPAARAAAPKPRISIVG